MMRSARALTDTLRPRTSVTVIVLAVGFGAAGRAVQPN
jgi:hypothetical protein